MPLKEKDKALTETELELMNLLWKLGEGSVNDVLAELPDSRKLAYTSVSTILRILEQKKIVGTRKEGRGHIYFPLLQKVEFEASTIKNVVSKVFDGAPLALVRQLLDTNGVSESDLKEMRKLLDERLSAK
jgi:predicted transcriptional regulator